MCGIAGIFAYGAAASPVDARELRVIREHMAARGPDGAGEFLSEDGRVGLGHRRLSIIDPVDRSAQPMESDCGRHVIVFNGEIYNYRALRSGLQEKGYKFRTQSDTEVLLHLYADTGSAMVERLRGMFAFAIWDAEKQGVFLARDGFGIKPLWYANNCGQFRWASQVRALLAGGALSHTPDPAGWVGFFLFGHVPEPYSTFRAIRALPAGSTLWVDTDGVGEPLRYFSVAATYREAESLRLSSDPSNFERVRAALLDSVRHHLVADVPVGIFLSAGVDSGALLGLMRDAGQTEPTGITLTYEEYHGKNEDEAPLAATIAARYGCKHHVRRVLPGEFRDDADRIFASMDQPTVDGINMWFVSKAAGELGCKAVISGLGGDELFGGYPSFRELPRIVRGCAGPSRVPFLAEAFKIFVTRAGLTAAAGPKLASLLIYGGSWAGAYLLRRGLFMPWELEALLDADLLAEGLAELGPLGCIESSMQPVPSTNFGRIASLESGLYMRNQLLRDADWASMAHSIEVRVPFVDTFLLRELAPIMARLPLGIGKRWLGASPSMPLPPELIERRKTGFGIPVADWLMEHPNLQSWRRMPQLAMKKCPWARRWAYQVAAA